MVVDKLRGEVRLRAQNCGAQEGAWTKLVPAPEYIGQRSKGQMESCFSVVPIFPMS